MTQPELQVDDIVYVFYPSSGRIREWRVEKVTPKNYFIKRMGGSFHDTFRLHKTDLNPKMPLIYKPSYWSAAGQEKLIEFAKDVAKRELQSHNDFVSNMYATENIIWGMK